MWQVWGSVFLASLHGSPALELKDGDRIALVGDGYFEREQRYGYLETALASRFPERNLRFRNLGWSGDTSAGESRVYFDPPETGPAKLKEHLALAQPTVLFLGWGMAETLLDPSAAEKVSARTSAVLASAKVRAAVLVAPIPHEDLGPPFPDPRPHRRALAAYASAQRTFCLERDYVFVDLFRRAERISLPAAARMTEDGIHPTEEGYWRLAIEFEKALGWDHEPIEVRFAQGSLVASKGTKVTDLEPADQRIAFTQADRRLPTIPSPAAEHDPFSAPLGVGIRLAVGGLPAGRYALSIDDKEVLSAAAAEWDAGLWVRSPAHDQATQLNRLIRRKDFLFFHRHRPQNITYLLGFRQHEQGQNAREIKQLDDEIARIEKRIERTRRPLPHRYVLQRRGD